MSNVYTHTNYAVLSVMNIFDTSDVYQGSTLYVQRKPESNYGNITTLSFMAPDADRADFDVQARFEANVVPDINTAFTDMDAASVVISNSNISVNSYSMDGKLNT